MGAEPDHVTCNALRFPRVLASIRRALGVRFPRIHLIRLDPRADALFKAGFGWVLSVKKLKDSVARLGAEHMKSVVQMPRSRIDLASAQLAAANGQLEHGCMTI